MIERMNGCTDERQEQVNSTLPRSIKHVSARGGGAPGGGCRLRGQCLLPVGLKFLIFHSLLGGACARPGEAGEVTTALTTCAARFILERISLACAARFLLVVSHSVLLPLQSVLRSVDKHHAQRLLCSDE